MKSKLYSLILIIIFATASCKTATRLYEKGNYDEAVELAAKKLQKDPGDVKLLNIIQSSYRYAVNDHEDKIRSHSQSSSEMKWEWMYADYLSLQKLYDAIQKTPSVNSVVKPQNYSEYLATYSEKAAEVRFARGLSFMDRHDKQSYRHAYREFRAATAFQPGNIEFSQKMREAFDYAVTNVIILPMQQYGGYVYGSYAVGAYNLDDQLLRSLQFSSGNEFLKFYSAWDARSRNIRADMILDMRLSTVNIGRYNDHRITRKVSKEVLIKETVIRPDSIVKEYGWVHADITTTGRTIRSEALLRVDVRDADGRWVWGENLGTEHNWNTEFATYTGDTRALSATDKALVERKQEPPPSEHEIMRCLVEQVNSTALPRIRNYFNRMIY